MKVSRARYFVISLISVQIAWISETKLFAADAIHENKTQNTHKGEIQRVGRRKIKKLQLALDQDNPKQFEQLVERFRKIKPLDIDGEYFPNTNRTYDNNKDYSAVQYAAKLGQNNILKYLIIEEKAQVSDSNPIRNPIYLAIKSDENPNLFETINILVEAHPDFLVDRKVHDSLMELAVVKNRPDVLTFLLGDKRKKGIDGGGFGTDLAFNRMLARIAADSKTDNPEILKILKENGINLDNTGDYETSLVKVINRKKLKAAKYLLDHVFTVTSPMQAEVLHSLVKLGDPLLLETLWKKGVDFSLPLYTTTVVDTFLEERHRNPVQRHGAVTLSNLIDFGAPFGVSVPVSARDESILQAKYRDKLNRVASEADVRAIERELVQEKASLGRDRLERLESAFEAVDDLAMFTLIRIGQTEKNGKDQVSNPLFEASEESGSRFRTYLGRAFERSNFHFLNKVLRSSDLPTQIRILHHPEVMSDFSFFKMIFAGVTYNTGVMKEAALATYMGNTLLQRAVELGNEEIVSYLLERGFTTNVRNLKHETPFEVAVKTGKPHLAFLLKYHSKGGNPTPDELTQDAHEAAARGYKDYLAYLMNRSGSDFRDLKTGETLLHTASKKGQVALVRYLMSEHKADPTAVDHRGFTPVHAAAFGDSVYSEGNTEVLREFKESKVDFNVRTKDGKTPYHLAAISAYNRGQDDSSVLAWDSDLFEVLLDGSADPNLKFHANGMGEVSVLEYIQNSSATQNENKKCLVSFLTHYPQLPEAVMVDEIESAAKFRRRNYLRVLEKKFGKGQVWNLVGPIPYEYPLYGNRRIRWHGHTFEIGTASAIHGNNRRVISGPPIGEVVDRETIIKWYSKSKTYDYSRENALKEAINSVRKEIDNQWNLEATKEASVKLKESLSLSESSIGFLEKLVHDLDTRRDVDEEESPQELALVTQLGSLKEDLRVANELIGRFASWDLTSMSPQDVADLERLVSCIDRLHIMTQVLKMTTDIVGEGLSRKSGSIIVEADSEVLAELGKMLDVVFARKDDMLSLFQKRFASEEPREEDLSLRISNFHFSVGDYPSSVKPEKRTEQGNSASASISVVGRPEEKKEDRDTCSSKPATEVLGNVADRVIGDFSELSDQKRDTLFQK